MPIERKKHMSRTSQINDELLQKLKKQEEVFWENEHYEIFEAANKKSSYSYEDVKEAEARLQRFRPFIRKAFPETEQADGLIESILSPIPEMKRIIEERYSQPIEGEFF